MRLRVLEWDMWCWNETDEWYWNETCGFGMNLPVYRLWSRHSSADWCLHWPFWRLYWGKPQRGCCSGQRTVAVPNPAPDSASRQTGWNWGLWVETEGHGYKTFSYCSKVRHDQDRLAIGEVKQGIRSKCLGVACLYTLVEHLIPKSVFYVSTTKIGGNFSKTCRILWLPMNIWRVETS